MAKRLSGLAILITFISGSSSIPVDDQCGGISYPTDTKWDAGLSPVFQNDLCGDSPFEYGSDGTTTGAATKAKTTTMNGLLISRSIPKGAITIRKNGGAQYRSISAALQNTSSNIYYIYGGNYTEAVYITRPNIQLYGETTDRSTYTHNKVTISRSMSAEEARGDDESGTVRISPGATDVKLYNLNIENTYGKRNGDVQAIALSAYGTRFGAYGCQVRGYQDTLLANYGLQFYSKSLIQGAVDFIWGQNASAWITKSVIEATSGGFITASGRMGDDPGWYVIDHSNVTGPGQAYLGRPWGTYARVVFQFTDLNKNVLSAGWSVWNNTAPVNNVYFGEHSNTGPGAWSTNRAPFAQAISTPVLIETVLGSDLSWIDPAYI